MTTHVLIACSKSKSIEATKALTWGAKTTVNTWLKKWNDAKKRYPVEVLYTGRSFRNQVNISRASPNTETYVISAGSGLICISNNVSIPSYEATFRKEMGPLVSEWHMLPKGGIGNLEMNSGDSVVLFAPNQYHRALLHDPDIETISSQLVVPSTSPLASISGTVIDVHSRAKEVLGVASTDLNTEFLRLFFSEGMDGFKKIEIEGEKLPPKVERTPLSDKDLLKLVGELEDFQSLTGLVRHLRDELLIKASVERISAARNSVCNE